MKTWTFVFVNIIALLFATTLSSKSDLISNDINTGNGPEIIKSSQKPPKPDGSKHNPRLKQDLESNITEWVAYWDDIESHWFFFNKIHNYSSWEKPKNIQNIIFDIPYDSDEGVESLKTILNCEEYEHAGCEAVARSMTSQARGTVIVNGIQLKDGGNFTQALKDNLKEHSLYKNIVKDIITFGIKFGGWTTLSMALYGGNILTAAGRKRRDVGDEEEGWRYRTEKAIKQYEEEMAEYMGDIVNDLEALQDLETFSVDTI